MTKDNKQQKLSDSTDTAIAYSTCCVSGAVSKDGISLIHGDSLQALKGYGDNHFDVAIVDPPYGISFGKYNRTNKARYKNSNWDDGIPTDEYFIELMRVSKNQIVWGGNYFPFLWKNGCKGFVFWCKGNPVPNFSDGELAWTSFNKVAKQIDYRYYGNLEGNTSASDKTHPTQKPVALYKWLLENYTSEGDLILDTHLGSGSIAIACHQMKRKLIGYEIDAEYYESACKRFKEETRQLALW